MHEADHELPAEEIEIFLRQHTRVVGAEKGLDSASDSSVASVSDPFAAPPGEFG